MVVDYVHRPSFELDAAVGVAQTPDASPRRDRAPPPRRPRRDDRSHPRRLTRASTTVAPALRYRYSYLAAVTHSDGRAAGRRLRHPRPLRRAGPRGRAPPVRRRAWSSASRSSSPARRASPRATVGPGADLRLLATISASSSILDAIDFSGAPIARVRLPRHVPRSRHMLRRRSPPVAELELSHLGHAGEELVAALGLADDEVLLRPAARHQLGRVVLEASGSSIAATMSAAQSAAVTNGPSYRPGSSPGCCSQISVSIGPGSTSFTRTPVPSRSMRADSLHPPSRTSTRSTPPRARCRAGRPCSTRSR